MKHILNNLTEQEKNAIREQHTGGMKVSTDNFNKLLESKLGDVKPILSEQTKPKMPPPAVNQQPANTQTIQLIQIKVGDTLIDLNSMEKTSQGANFYGSVRGNNKEYFQVLFNCGDNKVAMKKVNVPTSTSPQQSMISPAALTLLNKAAGCDAYVKNQGTSSDNLTLAEQPLPYKPSALATSMSKPIVGMLPQIKACVAQGGYPKLTEFLKKQENKQLDNIVIDMLMTFSVKKDPQASSEIGKLIECLKKTTGASTVQNKGVNEQAQTYTTTGVNSGGEQYDIKSPFKVGQTIKGKRSIDGQTYTITVTQVGQGFIAGKIIGPGTYNNKPLDGKFPWELNTNTPGVLHGNNEMGTFTIVK
jgi:hypothetical protein